MNDPHTILVPLFAGTPSFHSLYIPFGNLTLLIHFHFHFIFPIPSFHFADLRPGFKTVCCFIR